MHKLFTLSLFIFAFSFAVFSQTGSNKIYFDKAGKITTQEQAYYYRQRAESADSYKCYYVNGSALFFEGKIIQPNDSSESKNVYSGTCAWYYKNGKKKALRTFNEDGIETGTSSYYYESGKISKEIEYVNGQIANNRYKEFDEDGRISRIFEEDFANNNNDWDLYTSDKSSAKINNGILDITSNTNEGTSRYINLASQSDDYAIEAILNTEKSRESEKVGILFGFKDWQNYNFFAITQSAFYVGFVFEGVSSIKVEGMFSSAINKNTVNNVKIIGLEGKNIFSINGEVQYSADRLKLFGNNVGFAVSGKSSVSIDKLICKEMDYKSNRSNNTSKEDFDIRATGSGLIFTSSGYIVTNYHVVQDANKILVEMVAGESSHSYSAQVIQKDMDNDLAILKINDETFKSLASPTYSLKEGGSDVGSSVFTIGFPLALGGMGKEAKFADGKISSKTGYNNAINTYQTTIPVQPGNSGAPLFNNKGQLIGIINSKITGADNVSYAIKIAYFKNLIDLLSESVALPNSHELSNITMEDRVKSISNYVVLIKIK